MKTAIRLSLLISSILVLAGCFNPPSGNGSWKDRLRSFGGPVGSDVVVFEVAVLEVPAGEKYINGEMWAAIDDQVLSAESRHKLEDQGFRVGKVNGRPPDKLLDILTSERHNRAARRVSKRSGSPYAILVGPQRETFRFEPGLDGKAESPTYEQAQCHIQATPVIGSDGKVQFQFAPQIQHADKKKTGQLMPTLALGLQGNHATETFSGLSWEMPLDVNEYIIVGARFDKPHTLGFGLMITTEGERATQRVLAIRRLGSANDIGGPLTDSGPARRPIPAPQTAEPLAIP
jgi:hypothetical protein